mmetsp:Transcript_13247/g.44762  ORF Transcript_13247/g.44762 Transcript_13247/m.44762 type:complete len:230 (-) Transcript_13247:515-1204(-)
MSQGSDGCGSSTPSTSGSPPPHVGPTATHSTAAPGWAVRHVRESGGMAAMSAHRTAVAAWSGSGGPPSSQPKARITSSASATCTSAPGTGGRASAPRCIPRSWASAAGSTAASASSPASVPGASPGRSTAVTSTVVVAPSSPPRICSSAPESCSPGKRSSRSVRRPRNVRCMATCPTCPRTSTRSALADSTALRAASSAPWMRSTSMVTSTSVALAPGVRVASAMRRPP